MHRPRRMVWMKVRKIRWHGVMTETLKTMASNFVLGPGFKWKSEEFSEQSCCTHMPGLTKDKPGSMILYALKFIQGDQLAENYNNLILHV